LPALFCMRWSSAPLLIFLASPALQRLLARFQLTDSLSLNAMGIDYRYNVDLGIGANRDVVDFIRCNRSA